METALALQQEDFAIKSGIHFDPQNDTFIQHYMDALYPGATQLPQILVPALSSPDPSVTLKSQYLVKKGLDWCDHKIFNEEFPLSCPEGWIASREDSNYCLKVTDESSGLTSIGQHDECAKAGGERLYFSDQFYHENMFLDLMTEHPGNCYQQYSDSNCL